MGAGYPARPFWFAAVGLNRCGVAVYPVAFASG